MVMASSAEIHQIVLNLATNATYAMRGSKGLLRVTLTNYTMDADEPEPPVDLRPGPYVRLSVTDTGCGMDPATATAIKDYGGRFGMITFSGNERFLPGTFDWPAWKSRDSTHVNVLSRKWNGDIIASFDFWLPAKSLQRIPANLFLYLVFSQFPLESCKLSEHFQSIEIPTGSKQYDLARVILEAPYETLVEAHRVATQTLRSSTQPPASNA